MAGTASGSGEAMTHRFARGEIDFGHADIVRTPSSACFLFSSTSRRVGLDINRYSRSTGSVPVRGAVWTADAVVVQNGREPGLLRIDGRLDQPAGKEV